MLTVLGLTLLLMLRVDAAMHHLLVPSYNASAIYTFQLDDKPDRLTLLHNNTATAGGAWIALDVRFGLSIYESGTRIYEF